MTFPLRCLRSSYDKACGGMAGVNGRRLVLELIDTDCRMGSLERNLFLLLLFKRTVCLDVYSYIEFRVVQIFGLNPIRGRPTLYFPTYIPRICLLCIPSLLRCLSYLFIAIIRTHLQTQEKSLSQVVEDKT